MQNMRRGLSASVLGLLLGLGSFTVLAENGMQAGDPAGQKAQASQQEQVSDSQLALYIQAAQKVSQLQQKVQQDMQQAGNAEEAQVIQAEAQQEMVSAVQSFGMTVEEYNLIANLAQTDPEVNARLQQQLQQ